MPTSSLRAGISRAGRRLWRSARRLRGWLDEGTDVFAYFNNDIGGHAVADAAWLADRLGV